MYETFLSFDAIFINSDVGITELPVVNVVFFATVENTYVRGMRLKTERKKNRKNFSKIF